jgi:GTPase
MCPANILQTTIAQLTKILKSSGCRKIPLFIRDMSDVVLTAQNFVSERICPVFQLSSVSGQGLPELVQFLNLLPAYRTFDTTKPAEFQITDLFSVPGVGTVVSGNLQTGQIQAGETLLLGPDSTGQFTPCTVKSIQRKRLPVSICYAGQSVALALKKIKRGQLRKGMVMVGREIAPKAHWEFEAEVLVLYHSSTIGTRYQAMLHCDSIRQQCRIVGINQKSSGIAPSVASAANNASNASLSASSDVGDTKDEKVAVIRTGDRAFVRFQFLIRPEYIKVGSRLLFREGRTKGVGKVTAVF